MVIIDRWSSYRDTVSNDHLIKWSLYTGFLKKSACQIWRENYLERNQPFTKFVQVASNFTKLIEVRKHFKKFVKFANNLTKFVEFVNNFTKFVKFANNLTKFLGLASKFGEVRRSCEQRYQVSRNEIFFCKVRKILEQLYEVRGTRKQLLWSSYKLRTTLQS